MRISLILVSALLAGTVVGYVLSRFGWLRVALGIIALSAAGAVALILAGRAEGGFGGLGLVAIAIIMVAPFAAGVGVGAFLPRLLHR